MKFVLFVEGPTEKALGKFFRRWLDSRLVKRVGIQVVPFEGWADFVKHSPGKAAMHLKNSDVIAVIGLLDLYGPTFYPPDMKATSERYKWGRKYIEKKIGESRFRQFFAVHETEAWLLSDPNIFPRDIRVAFPGKVQNPETVNFDEPPAKLLKKLYKAKTRHTYKKVAYGNNLFNSLDPSMAYQKCPYLKELLDEMLILAQR